MNGGERISSGILGVVGGAAVAAVITLWGPSKSEFVTVREYSEYKDSQSFHFATIEKEISDIRVGIEGIQKRFDDISHQIDDRFDAIGISKKRRGER